MLDLGEGPVFCNVQWPSRAQAIAAAKAPIRLAACASCGHVFNEAFDPDIVAYAPGYENSQHSSTVFSRYAERLVERLATAYGLSGCAIVDIGCGRGELLEALARRVGGRGYGFDPSYSGGDASADAAVHVVREEFDPERARQIRPALICCRHVLEHLHAPGDFLDGVREAMAASGDPVLYLEVPNGTHLLRNAMVWDVLYEHVSYFTARSLRLALRSSGFRIHALYEAFGGQFLCVEAAVGAPARARSGRRARASDPSPADAAGPMTERIERWKRWSSGERRSGRTAAIWGAGTKGVMFLNLLGLNSDRPIPRALDQNPAKDGLFIPCTGQQISLPSVDALAGLSSVILMNSIYSGEVEARLAGMNVAVELLAAD
ncbi:MAG: methyltransferase domain-containing protein [Gammaproteobacteria bacterium]|nr:methyltransferase domain-containing protein [Gammaproteobacteria bacterium]